MALLVWTQALEVGIAEIDADHRVLVELLNRIHLASDQSDPTAAMAVLADLERYTDYHFAHEERLMDEYDYEFTALHQAEHRKLLSELKRQIDELAAGRIVAASVALFVQGWLLRHIVGTDRHLGEAIAASLARPRSQAQ